MRRGASKLTWGGLPLDDKETFELLSSGKTTDLFQLESAGMQRYIKELKPSTLGDIAAMIALYRPGPMEHIDTFIEAKHGRAPITYPHDSLKETAGRDLRGHRLSGPGAANLAKVRRLYSGRGGHGAKGHGQEDCLADVRGKGPVY